jgi:hypothetical protein
MTDAVSGVDPAEGSAIPGPSAPNIITLPDGNIVTLHPRVTTAIAVAVLQLINEGAPSQAVMFGRLSELYLELAPMAWTYDDRITSESIHDHLTVANGAVDVAEAADALYLKEIVDGPLAKRLRPRSPLTPTAGSTLPTNGSGSKSRTRSVPSSRNGTAGRQSVVRGR